MADDDGGDFEVMADAHAPEFPQELINAVIRQMRSMSDTNMFCAIIESEARHGLAKTLPNVKACRVLAEYKGKAPYLLLMGKLLEKHGRVLLAEIPRDSYAHVCAAVDAAHSALEKKGETHTVWLTVARGQNLIEYFERIMTAALNPERGERTLH